MAIFILLLFSVIKCIYYYLTVLDILVLTEVFVGFIMLCTPSITVVFIDKIIYILYDKNLFLLIISTEHSSPSISGRIRDHAPSVSDRMRFPPRSTAHFADHARHGRSEGRE